MALKRINLVARGDNPGAYFAHIFKSLSDGSELHVETTYEAYKGMGEKGGAKYNPTPPDGYEWTGSYSGHRFDTPSGRMEGDCFCEDGKDVMVQLKGSYMCCPKEIIAKMLTVNDGQADPAVSDNVDAYEIAVAVPKDGSEGFRITDQATEQELMGTARVSKEVVSALSEALNEEKK